MSEQDKPDSVSTNTSYMGVYRRYFEIISSSYKIIPALPLLVPEEDVLSALRLPDLSTFPNGFHNRLGLRSEKLPKDKSQIKCSEYFTNAMMRFLPNEKEF